MYFRHIALCCYTNVKWEIRNLSLITSIAPIFLQFNYFRQNLEENVTFTFYFFSFALNFPCKILWDNKNIDANIFIFSNSIFTMKGVRSKKVILRFFFKAQENLIVCKIWSLDDTPFRYVPHFWQISDGNIFPSIFEQFFTSQNWNFQIWIKNEQKLGLYFYKFWNSLFPLLSP